MRIGLLLHPGRGVDAVFEEARTADQQGFDSLWMSDHLSDLMLRLKRQLNLTSVVVTHDLDLMYKVADRVVVLFEGRAIYFGPVNELEKSDHPHIREFLAMDRVELVPGL